MTPVSTRSTASRPTWHDVFELIEAHRQESRDDHRRIEDRLTALESARTFQQGRSAGEARVFKHGKAAIVAITALVTALAGLLGLGAK